MVDAKKSTLLVVDDDPDIRSLLGMDFRRQGYDVLEAAGGRDAFEMIKSSKVDLVVTDILMPEGDGFELIDRIKNLSPKGPPVVVVTGCGDLSAKELGARGAGAIFFKPFDRKSLSSTVRQLLSA
jgi:two-component system phosphate regulon response regulator PhoB